jgi:hypothetical protein
MPKLAFSSPNLPSKYSVNASVDITQSPTKAKPNQPLNPDQSVTEVVGDSGQFLGLC